MIVPLEPSDKLALELFYYKLSQISKEDTQPIRMNKLSCISIKPYLSCSETCHKICPQIGTCLAVYCEKEEMIDQLLNAFHVVLLNQENNK